MRAYTYLIGWPGHDKWYYGVRFKPGCRTDELGTTYLSSSKYVKQFIAENGPSDVVEVRREFDTVDAARTWETTVLRRMRVVKSDRWLNRTDNKAIVHDGSGRRGKSSWNKGVPRQNKPEWIAKQIEVQTGMRWWTDGLFDIKARVRPGDKFRIGRSWSPSAQQRQQASGLAIRMNPLRRGRKSPMKGIKRGPRVNGAPWRFKREELF